jgi:hypothetical protein
MVPGAGFWQNRRCMQNASEAGAETAISAPSTPKTPSVLSDDPSAGLAVPASPAPARALEIGGPPGPEPTRYGDWEKKGRCIDF